MKKSKTEITESNIRKIYLFNIVSSLEFTASVFALYLLANGLNMTEVMLLESAYMIILLLTEIPSGALADTLGRKNALAGAMILLAGAFIIFAKGATFWTFFLANAVAAVAIATWSGADSAFIYDTLKTAGKEKEYGTVFGKALFFSMMGLAVASLAGGFMAARLGYRNVFFITAATFGAASIFALALKEPPVEERRKTVREYLSKLKQATKFAVTHSRVRSLIIYYSVFAGITHLAWFIIQPYYDNSGLPKYFVGIAVFTYFGFAGLGHYLGERLSRMLKEKQLTRALLGIAAVSFTAMKFAGPIAGIFLIAAMSLVSGVRDVFVSREVNRKTESKYRATVESVVEMGKGVAYAVLAIVFGRITDIAGPENTLLAMGVILAAFTLYNPEADKE